MPRSSTQRTVLAVAADGAHHETGIARSQGCRCQAELVEDTGAKALDDDVSAVTQRQEGGVAVWALEVEGHGLLAAVEGVKEHRGAIVGQRWRVAQIVAAGGVLDLDDLGTEVAQQLGAERPGQQPRQVQHSHTVKHAVGHRCLLRRRRRRRRRRLNGTKKGAPRRPCSSPRGTLRRGGSAASWPWTCRP